MSQTRVLDNIAPGDQYTEAATILGDGFAQLNVDVFKNGVYYQLGDGGNGGGGYLWGPEMPLPPGFRSLGRSFDAVRFRQRTAGLDPLKRARINVEALVPADLQ